MLRHGISSLLRRPSISHPSFLLRAGGERGGKGEKGSGIPYPGAEEAAESEILEQLKDEVIDYNYLEWKESYDALKNLAVGIEKIIPADKWPNSPKDLPPEIQALKYHPTFLLDNRFYVKYNPNDPKDFKKYVKRMRRLKNLDKNDQLDEEYWLDNE